MRRTPPLAHTPPMYQYPDHMDGTNWVAMGFMMVMLLVVVALVVFAVTQWSRGASTPRSDTHPARTARDLLDERLARGEIDVDEYQQRRHALDPPG
jgi:putative membrane protein